MAISISLPLQGSNYIPTSTTFGAVFNTVTPGRYSFDVPANQDVIVLPLHLGSIYLIERMFISGNIPAETYLSLCDTPATNPALRIKRFRRKVMVSTIPIPIIQFTPNRESPMYFYSDQQNDELTLSLSGELAQNIDTVGIDPINVTISLSIYEVNEKYWSQGLRTAMQSEFGLSKKVNG